MKCDKCRVKIQDIISDDGNLQTFKCHNCGNLMYSEYVPPLPSDWLDVGKSAKLIIEWKKKPEKKGVVFLKNNIDMFNELSIVELFNVINSKRKIIIDINNTEKAKQLKKLLEDKIRDVVVSVQG